MNSTLDPVILEKLRAFARRRKRLIILRGVLATLATLMVAMIVVAAFDYWIPLLADGVRWALSGTAYAAVLIIVWRHFARPLLHAPDERQIARIVEHAEPRLREDLLSAVELGNPQGEVFDSAQFRALLQSDVSARVKDLQVETLLPVSLLKRYIHMAAIIGVVVVVLMLLSGFRFGTLFLRALLPGANLENVRPPGLSSSNRTPAIRRWHMAMRCASSSNSRARPLKPRISKPKPPPRAARCRP